MSLVTILAKVRVSKVEDEGNKGILETYKAPIENFKIKDLCTKTLGC